MSRDVLIGIDQGTSGTRTVAFDLGLRPLADAYRPAEVSHPHPGWIEKDADETVRTVEESLAEVVAAVGADRIAAVGLDNEGETVVAWDAGSLAPLAPAIVWGCRRSQPIVDRLAASGDGAESSVSGLPLDPYFSATKIRWLVEYVLPVAAAAARAVCVPARSTLPLRAAGRGRPHGAVHRRPDAATGAGRPGTWDPSASAARHRGGWLPPIGDSAGELRQSRRPAAARAAGRPDRLPCRARLPGRGTAKATYAPASSCCRTPANRRRPGWRACCRSSPGRSVAGRPTRSTAVSSLRAP